MSAVIAIATPVYRHAAYLDVMLQSLRVQSFGRWECAVVLDGPDDAALAIVQQHADHDPRIRFTVLPTHAGLPAARNQAVRMTTAPWLLPFDADDVMHPRMLEAYIAASRVAPERKHPVIFSPATCDYGNGKTAVYKYPLYNRATLAEQVQMPGSAMHPRALYDLLGGFDEAWNMGATDWMYWIRGAALNKIAPMQLPQSYWTYRQHNGFRNHRRGEAVLERLKPHMQRALAGTRAFGEPIT